MKHSASAQLALDTILGKPTRGIPIWSILPMEHRIIDRLAGVPEGTYRDHPEPIYLRMLANSACCLLDQYIPTNPLSMGSRGYESETPHSATTGAETVVLDGLRIDSPEAVVEHLERFVFPALQKEAQTFDEDTRVSEILAGERRLQALLGPDILKTGYGFISGPGLAYFTYGYVNYFMAYALYPEVMERHFALQADRDTLVNRAVARAYREGGRLPPLYRLDHDMADSRGTLVDVKSLDRIWFPHFARALEPVLNCGVKLIWHCDGNLREMVPRLLEVGLHGFQGFQYEDGMDYEAICRMKTRDGDPLFIIGGVSVTRTLPHGTPEDVRREMKWLVEKGPRTGLVLGGTSSITPGVPWENMQTLVEGFKYYREHGR
jgi:hypothetical protein